MAGIINMGTRQKKAYLFCLLGMAVDAALGLIKVFMGWQSGSIAVIGDGFNNITDVGSAFLLLLTFYYSSKPSDKEHPFGHGRLEYLNSTVMASVVLYVGITLFVDSVQKIIEPEPIVFSPLLVAALLVGVAGKFLLSLVYRKAQRETQSDAFKAYGADSISDVLSTVGVLVAILVETWTGLHIDGWMGVVMSVIIMYTGYGILRKALDSIIGAPPDRELYEKVEAFMMEHQGIYGVHDLIIHDYGPENQFLTAHIEMDSRLGLIESHEIAESLMENIKETFHIQAVLHMDPKVIDNPREPQYRRDLEAALFCTHLPLSYHDFFVEEKDGRIYISFEVSFLEPSRETDQEVYKAVDREMRKINPAYKIDLVVDRNFISGKRYGAAPDGYMGK